MVFLKEFFEKIDFEKNQQMKKKHEKFPRGKRVKLLLTQSVNYVIFDLDLTLSLLVSSADNLFKKFGPRQNVKTV